ncbi:hypothetical protein [Cytobacillus gottheilii]|uniref:hypothetical protein n=1 Tax=Cytobacillus gottheilii TaxID=859144 RepID=UPI00159399D0|nr:hypothetical protein [Cytobacillus gottheilii]
MEKNCEKIVYNNEIYYLIKINEAGYCEIKKSDMKYVELIHRSELKETKDAN